MTIQLKKDRILSITSQSFYERVFIMSTIPIYQRVYEEILNNILNGNYEIGCILPSEAELENLFAVSRTPIRQALKQLDHDGYITRSKGKKSIVKSSRPSNGWETMTGLQHNYREDEWKRITAKTFEIKIIESKEYAEKLGLYLNYNVLHLKRIRSFNQEPVLYGEHYINPLIPMKIFEDNLTALAVSEILKKDSNIQVVRVHEEIEAITATNDIALYLKLKENSPLLKVSRNSYTEDGKLIDINIYYVKTDTWKYEVTYTL